MLLLGIHRVYLESGFSRERREERKDGPQEKMKSAPKTVSIIPGKLNCQYGALTS
jgi:hypothetical protein